MNALAIILLALGMYAIAHRYYSAFIAAKILTLDDQRLTPAHRLSDGQNYVPTNKGVLLGHHFAAITGAGPLIGPVLAAPFGFLPGLLWLVIGVCLGGAVHDFIIFASSVRHDGKSLAEMARTEIGAATGIVTAVVILFIIMALAGLAVVNALHDSAWGTFTIATTIPIALLMGLYMYHLRKGKIAEASAIRRGAVHFGSGAGPLRVRFLVGLILRTAQGCRLAWRINCWRPLPWRWAPP